MVRLRTLGTSVVVTFLTAEAFSPQALQGLQVLQDPRRESTVLAAHDTKTLSSTDLSSLPLPPHRPRGPFRKIKDFVSYLKNPEEFIEVRSKELGPVFMTNLFLKPAVVVGGPDAVGEFIRDKELTSRVVHSALPDTFSTLHTEWGALNLDSTDVLHKQARTLFAEILGKSALEHYASIVNAELDNYIDDLEQRIRENPDTSVFVTPEFSTVCLQLFAQIFSGEKLSPEQVQDFVDYNYGLLAASKLLPAYKRGKHALETLRTEMTDRHERLASKEGPGKFYFDKVNSIYGFSNNIDRRAVASLLFIWGAYAETAALMANSLILLRQDNGSVDAIRKEFETASAVEKGSTKISDLPYTHGTVRESLRLIPQVGGGFRYGDEDFELCGFRIPAGTAVTLEPRIGNKDPTLYPNPESFEPERWMPESKNVPSKCPFRGSALGKGPTAWFPGGVGAHGCPGIPLAELVATLFVGKMASRFDGWEYSGDGLTKQGAVAYTEIPIKIPSDDFGLKFRLR